MKTFESMEAKESFPSGKEDRKIGKRTFRYSKSVDELGVASVGFLTLVDMSCRTSEMSWVSLGAVRFEIF